MCLGGVCAGAGESGTALGRWWSEWCTRLSWYSSAELTSAMMYSNIRQTSLRVHPCIMNECRNSKTRQKPFSVSCLTPTSLRSQTLCAKTEVAQKNLFKCLCWFEEWTLVLSYSRSLIWRICWRDARSVNKVHIVLLKGNVHSHTELTDFFLREKTSEKKCYLKAAVC